MLIFSSCFASNPIQAMPLDISESKSQSSLNIKTRSRSECVRVALQIAYTHLLSVYHDLSNVLPMYLRIYLNIFHKRREEELAIIIIITIIISFYNIFENEAPLRVCLEMYGEKCVRIIMSPSLSFFILH